MTSINYLNILIHQDLMVTDGALTHTFQTAVAFVQTEQNLGGDILTSIQKHKILNFPLSSHIAFSLKLPVYLISAHFVYLKTFIEWVSFMKHLLRRYDM